MSLSLSETHTVAVELDGARRRGKAIVPPAELALFSLVDAYAVQAEMAARRARDGETRSGWKLGLTSDVKQQLMGIDHPLFGQLFAGGAITGGNRVRFSDFIQPRVEPEIAFGLAAPLVAGTDADALLGSVAWFAPALEITDSRYLPGRRSAVELVADNTSAAAYVIGPPIALAARADVVAREARLVRNGSVVAAGTTADVLGDPLIALVLLARHLDARGAQTAAGDVVLSGAITDAFSAAIGDRFEAHLDGLGRAEVTFV